MDKDSVIKAAIDLLKRDNHGELKTYQGDELIIVEDKVHQHGIAWIVPYNTRAYLEHGDFEKCLFPSGIVVPTDGGQAHYAPGVPPFDEYVDAVQRGEWHWPRQDETSTT